MLSEAIIGTWTNPFVTVTVHDDGTLHARLPDGSAQRGRWWVEPGGQLSAEVMGMQQSADASVQGDWLTVSLGGRSVRLQRA